MKTSALVGLLALVPAFVLVAGCEQSVQDRPVGTYEGSFRPPPLGGGGGGDDDGGVADGGAGETTDVQGRVVALEHLGRPPDRGAGVPDRRVAGYDAAGGLVAVVSGAEGAFTLSGIARTNPVIVSTSGEPPSFVVLEASRLDAVSVPVIEQSTLEDLAASVATAPGAVVGHAFVWLEDARGEPVHGLAVEVLSPSPLEGPFYGTSDPVQLTEAAPTDAEGLVVLLNAVAGEVELSVFAVSAPETTETVVLPIEAGVVTFYEVTTRL